MSKGARAARHVKPAVANAGASDPRSRASAGASDPRTRAPARQWGSAVHPAVRVELYGSLRIRTGRPAVTLRADSIRTALRVLVAALPEAARHLPPEEELSHTHRFSINGAAVTTNLDTPLSEGDQLVLFSASVGG